MKKLILLFAALLISATSVCAQTTNIKAGDTTVVLAFDHDGLNTTNYDIAIDLGSANQTIKTVIPAPVKTGEVNPDGTFVFQTDFPALTPGIHTIQIRADNVTSNTDSGWSNPLTVNIYVQPGKPANLRIIVIR